MSTIIPLVLNIEALNKTNTNKRRTEKSLIIVRLSFVVKKRKAFICIVILFLISISHTVLHILFISKMGGKLNKTWDEPKDVMTDYCSHE